MVADSYSEVKKTLAALFGLDPRRITRDTRIRGSLGLGVQDDLDYVEILFALEERFGIEFSAEETQGFTSFSTVGEIVRSVNRKLGYEDDIPMPLSTHILDAPVPKNRTALQALSIPSSRSIFASYSRSDWINYVDPLLLRLGTKGISVWVDQHLIQGGQDWQDEIDRALEICERMILFITPRSLDSKYVKMEYRYFFNNNKLLVPIMCEKAKLPAELQGIQYTDYTDFSRLLRLLQ